MPDLPNQLFQVEIPQENRTHYTLELFHKLNYAEIESNSTSFPSHITKVYLDAMKLKDLDESNFESHSGLNFDIRNRSKLTAFVSDLYSIKAKIDNLLLLSFDNEDLMNCQQWNIMITFDFMQTNTARVIKEAEYFRVACKPAWKDLIYYYEEEVEVKFNQRVACS